MESYKSQIAELETKASARSKEIDALKFELDQTKTKLKLTEEERAKDSETLELYQERVRELELSSQRPVAASRARPPANGDGEGNMTEFTEAELLGGGAATRDDVDVDADIAGLGEELDSAITGTTMTDLKLQVRMNIKSKSVELPLRLPLSRGSRNPRCFLYLPTYSKRDVGNAQKRGQVPIASVLDEQH